MSSTTTSESTQYNAIAAMAQKTALVPFKYTPLPLKPTDVEISISACGVCHSDLHQVHNDWGFGAYPMVPGHEIIGEVIAVGSAVTELKVGQRVGVTPQISSCKTCKDCLRGETQLCRGMVQVYGSPTGNAAQPFTFGGFSSHIRVDQHWAFPVPTNLPIIGAAPLLCAGITVWSPFVHHKLGVGSRVGIVGVGGLGHLAVKFGVAFGCHVTGISTSSNKKDEILGFGAHAFLNMSDAKDVASKAQSFDALISTISANGVNWDQYLDLLASDGKLIAVGAPNKMEVTPFKLLMGRLSIHGSGIASNAEVRNMLTFCGKHNIVAQTEERDMTADGANQALAKVEANAARYRMVLVNRSKIPAATTTTAAASSAPKA